MKIIAGTTDFTIEEMTAVAIGKFDGIHKGHKRLLDEIFKARNLGLKTAVFTFDPSPAVFFKGNQAGELMTREENVQPLKRWVWIIWLSIRSVRKPRLFRRRHMSGNFC